MAINTQEELRRQLEEPLNLECRNYPLPANRALVTMLDTPYYPPFATDAYHYHNCMEIGLCVSGSGSVRLHEKRYPFSVGSVIVAPKGVYHNQEYGEDQMIYWRYLVVNEDYLLRSMPVRYQESAARFLSSIAQRGLYLDGGTINGADALIHLMFDLRRSGEAESSPTYEMCLILLMDLFSRHAANTPLSTANETPDAHMRQPIEPALAYVYEHYKEDIQIGALARSCSMSESYFRKTFARIMGQSPLEYINRYRIHRSMNLLRTTGDPIQYIAVRAGFSSIAAYNRNFSKYVGENPSAWRQKHRSR